MPNQPKPTDTPKIASPTPDQQAGLANDEALIARNLTEPGIVDLTLRPNPTKTLGIVGCGLMGCSIAALAADSQMRVVMVDASESAIAAAKDLFSNRRGTDDGSNHDADDIQIGNAFESLAGVDLVIEAVVETLPVKKSVHEKIEAVVGPTTLIATNTSSIPLASMEPHLRNPARFCGIHFCHPEVMALVEVIASNTTEPQTVADAVGFVRQLKKMPIAIRDSAGFVVNRLLAAMLNQALRLLTEGMSVSQIDAAMRDFGFQAGPFEIIDIIGADTCMYAGRTMWEHKMKCVSLSPVLPRMVKHGRLGRKSGAGFYKYPDARGAAIEDPELVPLIAPYCKSDSSQSSEVNDGSETAMGDATEIAREEIACEVLAPVALEATRLIEEGIVHDFRDIDLAFTHGLSFPQTRGGLLFWADQTGLSHLNSILQMLRANDPRMEPTQLLKTMAEQNRSFYGNCG